MKLDIIVPHYHEPWEVCKYLFTSISTQRMVNFENIRVILVNDGDEVILSNSLFEDFPYEVQYIVKPHTGVSATRNCGLDASNADYVMFCDADDGFMNDLGIYMIKLEADKGYDVINPIFIEECLDLRDNHMFLASHKSDATFLHGKAYRRQFLVDNDIRFPDNLNLHEDGYFNALAVCCGQNNSCEVNAPIYMWCWNENSVVRKDFDFTLRTYDKLCECWRLTLKWLKEHEGFEREYRNVLAKVVLSTFYSFQTPPYLVERNRKYVKNAEKAFKQLYIEIRNDYLAIDPNLLSKMMDIMRADARDSGFAYEQTDIKSWLKHIEYEV